jgi:galactonate dehydratase
MKIVDFKTYVVGNPPPSFGGKYWIFLKLTTDSGIFGFGEAYGIPFHPKVARQMIEDVCERYILNENPFNIEKIWRRVFSSGYSQRPDISLGGVLSAIEIALWDINGKELNKPIYELLGGKHTEKLRTYTYIYPEPNDASNVYTNAILAGERATEYLKQGFDAVKFDPVGLYKINDPRVLTSKEISFVADFVKTIREAVGDQCDLLIGTHGQMTPESAIRLSTEIEKYDPFWLEEPVPPNNSDAMAKVARYINFPVAAGERLTTKYEFNEIINKQAASILQLNMGRVGGILEGKKIASMAEANHLSIAPHMYCGPIVAAANIQVAASISNFLILEGIKDWKGFDCKIMKKYFKWEAGSVLLNEAPGLGVEIDEDMIESFPYDGDSLHLEMSE